MTSTFVVIIIIISAVLWYAIVGRAWLKTKPWASGFFTWVEPAEILFFRKSETILVGRLLWAGGLVVTLYDGIAVFASSLDLTPLTSRALASVPEDMRGLVVTATFAALGYLMNWLRKRVTKPIEVVSVAEKDITPAVAQALDTADAAKVEAVAAVTAAQS